MSAAVELLASQPVTAPEVHARTTSRLGYRVVSRVVGVGVLITAGLKSYSPDSWTLLEELGPGVSRASLVLVIQLEIALGLLLVCQWSTVVERAVRLGAIAFFATALGAALGMHAQGQPTCGCMGRVSTPPSLMAALDVAVLILFLAFRPANRDAAVHWRRNLLCLGVAMFALGVPAGMRAATRGISTQLRAAPGAMMETGANARFVPERWVGKPFPLLPFVDVGDSLAAGEWLVLLYDPNSARDHHAARVHQQRARREQGLDQRRFALVETQPPQRAGPSKSGACLYGRITESLKCSVASPTVVQLQSGVVIACFDGASVLSPNQEVDPQSDATADDAVTALEDPTPNPPKRAPADR
jgi:hypothetical protein